VTGGVLTIVAPRNVAEAAMTYLERFDATPEADQFALARGWLDTEALPFVNELREKRPILKTSVCTFVADFADTIEVLRVHLVFTNEPCHAKMDPYLMSQDDTPMHFRDKSAMSAFLDRADIPRIRALVGSETKAALDAANGQIDAVPGLTRISPFGWSRSIRGCKAPSPESWRNGLTGTNTMRSITTPGTSSPTERPSMITSPVARMSWCNSLRCCW
jgi:hypothetical protein